MKIKVGALTIGQSPRPDLVTPLAVMRPEWDILQLGALDGLTAVDLPDARHADYPLGTRLRDGTAVTVAESYLIPRLQLALERLEAQGVQVTVLLCAGSFAALRGQRPLLKPFDIAYQTLHSLGVRRLGVLTPFAGQIPPIQQRWQALGFEVAVWARALEPENAVFQRWLAEQLTAAGPLQALVLDYVGHPPATRLQLQALAGLPVVDLGHLALSALVAIR